MEQTCLGKMWSAALTVQSTLISRAAALFESVHGFAQTSGKEMTLPGNIGIQPTPSRIPLSLSESLFFILSVALRKHAGKSLRTSFRLCGI